MRTIIARIGAPLAVAALMAGCAGQSDQASRTACPAVADGCPACPVCPQTAERPPAPPLAPADFADIPGWHDDALEAAWDAFLTSCSTLINRAEWQSVCSDAVRLTPEPASVRAFFESRFRPFQLTNPDGTTNGLITGYYEPLLRGSRTRGPLYRYPLYAPPEDLLIVDLSEVVPDTKHMRLRGRLEGRKVVPYYSRAEIENGVAPVAGKEIVYVDDAVEAFFLQIQGSGRVQLPDGSMVRVGYADQNGHPYKSIGRLLVERGELALHEASMQGIQRWARANPAKLPELLDQNPSYVFFRELPEREGGPLGALGVPLTPERSIAIDPRHVPLGAPVFLATTRPNSDEPLRRLMIAQDTGGAIRGVVRADFYWGFGAAAGALAGRMRQQGSMWVLLPVDHPRAVIKAPTSP